MHKYMNTVNMASNNYNDQFDDAMKVNSNVLKIKFFFILLKYERGRAHIKDEKESCAFAKLSSLESVSSDNDDTDTQDKGGWVSRPSKYKSKTFEAFLNK